MNVRGSHSQSRARVSYSKLTAPSNTMKNTSTIGPALPLAVASGILGFAASASAAQITVAGIDVPAPQTTEWKTSTTPKTFDIDGDNIYGSLASINFTIAFPGAQALGSSTLGVGFVGSGPQFNQPEYADIDKVTGGPVDENAGLALNTFTFELTGTAEDYTGKTVRVGFMQDILGAGEQPADLGKTLELTQVAGIGGGASGIVPVRGLAAGDGVPEFYFFDITGVVPGDRFTINSPNPVGAVSGYISAGSFDLIPEPSTALALVTGIGMLSMLRRRG